MANGFQSFKPATGGGFASFQSFGGAPDPNSVDGLLYLAQQHGGAVGEAANELVHPNTSILSTIGNGFKNAFKEFVNVISVPSQVVAGAISNEYTIKDAIKLDIRPSDVIFGKQDTNATTMRKVGNFVVRTATDILLDPLTYVTFGVGSGSLFGARAAIKVPIFDSTGTLTKAGLEHLNYLKKVERQSKGLQSALSAGGDEAARLLPDRLKTFQEIRALEESGRIAPEVSGMGKDELKRLLAETIDAPLHPDFAKLALGRALEKSPALTETLLDKGGIKFFGQSLLSGQRISSVVGLIPGMTWLDNATEQSRLAISSLFNPEVKGFKQSNGATQFVRLPPEYMEFERRAADMAEYLKEERIKNMAAIMKANKIDPNTSGQFFMASVENGVVPTDPALARAYRQLLGYNEKELKYLREAGIPISKLDNHAPHVLVSSGIKLLPVKMPPATKVGAALHRTMEGPIFDMTPEQLKSFEEAVVTGNEKMIKDVISETKSAGFEIFDDNFFTASVARSMDNVRSGTMKNLVDALSSNFARKASEAPEGWVGLNLTKFKSENELLVKRGFTENQLVFHPAVARKIEEFTGSLYGDEGMNTFLSAYDRLQNVWKASVTSIFPAFHGRNALSNVFLNFNDIGFESINPMTHAMSSQVLFNDHKINGLLRDSFGTGAKAEAAKTEMYELMSKPMFKDASGYDWTFGELRTVIKQNNIALRDNIVGQIDIARTPEEMLHALMPASFKQRINPMAKGNKINPLTKNFKPYEIGRKFGNVVEGQARLVNFLTNLRKTGDVGLATARTKQFLFDYQHLTPFEKSVMKRLMPFYTFTRKNLEAQVSTLLSAPGRTAAQLTTMANLGDAISGAQLTPEEQEMLPEWIRGTISTLTSRDGSKVELIGSLGTPIEQPFQAFQPNILLASVSPYIRLPVELGAGYDFFQGKPLADITNAAALKRAPQAIKDFVGYTDVSFENKDGETVNFSVALRPNRLHLILNMPLASRVLSSIKQMDSVDVSSQNKILQQLIGIRPFAFDLELEEAKREAEMKDKLEQLLSDAGVGYQLERFIPKK